MESHADPLALVPSLFSVFAEPGSSKLYAKATTWPCGTPLHASSSFETRGCALRKDPRRSMKGLDRFGTILSGAKKRNLGEESNTWVKGARPC